MPSKSVVVYQDRMRGGRALDVAERVLTPLSRRRRCGVSNRLSETLVRDSRKDRHLCSSSTHVWNDRLAAAAARLATKITGGHGRIIYGERGVIAPPRISLSFPRVKLIILSSVHAFENWFVSTKMFILQP